MQLNRETLVLGLSWYLVFLFSTVLHEAAHAFVSWRLGDTTAYEGGQVTLNPVPHIQREPVGTILVPLISFLYMGFMIGWASAPFNPLWAQRYPRRAALMSLAGPASNLFLVVVAGLLIRAGLAIGFFAPPAPEAFALHQVVESTGGGFLHGVSIFLSILFILNAVLFTFNLLPLPPLDGSGVVPLFLPGDLARKYQEFLWQPGFSMVGLIAAWFVFPRVFPPVLFFVLDLVY